MQYVKEIEVNKNTSASSPEKTFLKCAKGIIHRVNIVFPPGCVSLVHAVCKLGGHPIIPSTQGMSYSGDKEVVVFDEHIELKEDQNSILIETWNEDDTYNHTIQIRLFVLPKEYLLRGNAFVSVLSALNTLIVAQAQANLLNEGVENE